MLEPINQMKENIHNLNMHSQYHQNHSHKSNIWRDDNKPISIGITPLRPLKSIMNHVKRDMLEQISQMIENIHHPNMH